MTELSHLTPIKSSAIPEEIDGIPYFHQRDERWFSEPYTITGDPEQTIGTSGCVPTTEAMVHAAYSGDLAVSPFDLAKCNLYQGYRTPNHGTSSLHSLPAFVREFHYGLEPLEPTPEEVRRVLGKGGLVYTVLRGGANKESLATSEAHVVLIRELTVSGELKAHTSESVEKSLRPWDADEVLSLADARRTFGIYREAA